MDSGELRDRLFSLIEKMKPTTAAGTPWTPILSLSFKHGFTTEIAKYFEDKKSQDHYSFRPALAHVSDETPSSRAAKNYFKARDRHERFGGTYSRVNESNFIEHASNEEKDDYNRAFSGKKMHVDSVSPDSTLASFLRSAYFRRNNPESRLIVAQSVRYFGDPTVAAIFRQLKYGLAQKVRFRYAPIDQAESTFDVTTMPDTLFYAMVTQDQTLAKESTLVSAEAAYRLRRFVRYILSKVQNPETRVSTLAALAKLRDELSSDRDIDLSFARTLMKHHLQDVSDLLGSESNTLNASGDPNRFLNLALPPPFSFPALVK